MTDAAADAAAFALHGPIEQLRGLLKGVLTVEFDLFSNGFIKVSHEHKEWHYRLCLYPLPCQPKWCWLYIDEWDRKGGWWKHANDHHDGFWRDDLLRQLRENVLRYVRDDARCAPRT